MHQPSTSADSATSAGWGRYLIPALIVAVAVGLTSWIHYYEILDRAYRFLITVSALGGGAILLSLWFAAFAPLPLRTRMKVVAPFWGALLLMGALLRIDMVSGDVTPTLVWRWSAKVDAGLPNAAALARSADAESASESAETASGDYPGFLGPDRRPMIEGVKLARDWKAQPPKKLWRQKIGAGWSQFSVMGPYAVTQEQRGEEELIVCYVTTTGRVRWVHVDAGRFSSTLGGDGPRATPTIADGKVYAIGATGQFNCLDLASGKKIWTTNVQSDFGLTPDEDLASVAWGRAGSPLIVDNMVVVPAGGPAKNPVSLVGYDKNSGKQLCEGGKRQISYSSPSLATLGGVRQIVIMNEDTITGHDPATLEELWAHEWSGHSNSDASVPQTIQVGRDRLFVSKGYSGGGSLFSVSRDESGRWTTQTVWQESGVLKTKFTTVVIHDGFVYGLSDGILECVELETGKRRWKSGRHGHGQLLLVGDLILVQTEAGEIILMEASPEKATELATFQAIEGQSWNNPALAGRLLLVRNSEEAACYELPLAE